MPPTHWRSPDGAVERTLLPGDTVTGERTAADDGGPGSGDGGPQGTSQPSLCQSGDLCQPSLCQPGAVCQLRAEFEPDCPVPAGLDLSDPAVSAWLPAGRATLGEADTELDRLLDRCLRTVRSGDRCQARLRLRPDRLPGPAAAGGRRQEVELSLRLTVLSVSGGQPDAALGQQERLAAAEAARRRGNELFAAGRPVDAFYRYRRALALLVYLWPPELGEAEQRAASAARLACRANLAAVQLRVGRHEAARAAASRVLAEQPDHVRCLYRRGAASLALQDLEEAERDLRRVMEIEPQNAAAARQMALLERSKRQLDQHTADYMTKYFQQ